MKIASEEKKETRNKQTWFLDSTNECPSLLPILLGLVWPNNRQ